MRRPAVGLLFALLLALVVAFPAAANHTASGPLTGHLPPSNANVDLIGKLKVSNVVNGWVTDVATYRDTAYLGAWNVQCQGAGNPGIPGGFWSVDIKDPANPKELAFVSSPPGSYLTEGVHAFRLTTPSFSGDVLLVSQEICSGSTVGVGGFSLYDVTNPATPVPLAMSVGDTAPTPTYGNRPHPAHTAFGWDTGDKAYVAVMDNAEEEDIDIFDITDPRNPVMIKETGINDWPPAALEGHSRGGSPGLHDLIVRRVEGKWLMLASYWDAGYVVLDVTNPANPVYMKKTNFSTPDPVAGTPWTEGNAHEAEWDRCPEEGVRSTFPCGDVRYIVAADEDFTPYPIVARITSGPFANQEWGGAISGNSKQIGEGEQYAGPSYYVGLACNASPPPVAPSPTAIAIAERGTCAFSEKYANIVSRGYSMMIVMNTTPANAASAPCESLVNMLITPSPTAIPAIFVARSTGFRLLGITGYSAANCQSGGPNPSSPAVGTQGSNLDVSSTFDGWGYMRLFNADTMQELDTFSIPQAQDPRYASGFGDLTVHEVTTDPTGDVGYVSWYSAGMRVMDFSTGKLQEVGHHIDERGNDMWGVELNVRKDGRLFVLGSDRDYGLYVYRFGTDLRPTKVSSPRTTRVGRTFSYTIRVGNSGTIPETNTVVRDKLPAGVRFVSASATQGRCSYRAATRTVVCNLGRLVNDASGAQVRINVRALTPGVKRNTAFVNGVRAEYDVGNNSASTTTRVRRAPRAGVGAGLTGRQG
jgi:uncharacterized repeat protein (TIGR01451 family)